MFLVGRELCLFTTLDASKAPSKQRKEFAALAVRRAAPFSDPDFDAAWFPDGMAAIWYWSRTRVNALAASEPGKRKRFVAEALHTGQPIEDGIELLSLPEGIEARIWSHSHLKASRWWPGIPDSGQWQDFLRGSGQMATVSVCPEPVTAHIADTAWNRQSFNTEKLQLSGIEQYLPKLAFLTGATLLLACGAQIGSIARAQIDIWRAQSTANSLDAPLKRILDAREATDKATAEITGMLSLRGVRPTTSLMAELTRLMPGQEWQVKKWSQPTQDTIEINLVAPGSNPEALVSTLEASPMFKGVTTELGRDNELTIKATLTPPPGLGGEQTQ